MIYSLPFAVNDITEWQDAGGLFRCQSPTLSYTALRMEKAFHLNLARPLPMQPRCGGTPG